MGSHCCHNGALCTSTRITPSLHILFWYICFFVLFKGRVMSRGGALPPVELPWDTPKASDMCRKDHPKERMQKKHALIP